jgi:histidine decarboxylase
MQPSSISDEARRRLRTFMSATRKEYPRFIGFPAALDYEYEDLMPMMDMFLNNLGDPYVDPLFKVHTKQFEREVVDFYAQLFRAPADDYWGYVTNGSSECNLYALYVAREKFDSPVVYYSTDAHYSIPKNIYILNMTGEKIPSQKNGEMDYDRLRTAIASHPGRPAIVVATIGTTMTEAKDNVATIKQILREAGVAHHIHADAALSGIYTALLEPHHPFDFEDGVNSINISGHKFVGSPIPSGVIIVHKRDKDLLKGALNYIGSPDTTITGSRNGHTPLFLWYAIEKYGIEGFKARAEAAQKMADYTYQQLQKTGWETWRNPGGLTVMIKSPTEELIHKWQLATYEGWSHIICMPGVKKSQIDAFIADLQTVAKPKSAAVAAA